MLTPTRAIPLLLLSLMLSAAATPTPREPLRPRPQARQFFATPRATTDPSIRFKAGAGPDTFCLYGGPGSTRGKFERADGSPVTMEELRTEPTNLAGEADGWVFVDVTDNPLYWQTHTFMMANLNSHGAGNHGMWVGRDAEQEPGWANAPGYGNDWRAILTWRTADLDPTAAQSVSLAWVYNLDTEAGFDHFNVEYDSAGSSVVGMSVSGTTKNPLGSFDAPGTVGSLVLPYEAGSYAHGNTEIVIRMTGTSDGGYSDQDEYIDTDGFVQVDDITVGWTDSAGIPRSDTDAFEGADTGPAWTPEKPLFAGFFGREWGKVGDIDPCRENPTPVFAFLDDGTPPSNPDYDGPGTGGATSINWGYGPGGWVVNHSGGVSNGVLGLENEVWTPPIAWDLPGTLDDGPEVAGALVRFSVWAHLPLLNGYFWSWGVRARDRVTSTWTEWDWWNYDTTTRAFGNWQDHAYDVSELVATANGPDGVQLLMLIRDAAAVFAFPGTDATTSPIYDNLAFFKYRIGGPQFSTAPSSLFNDSFSQSGLSAHGTASERDALDVRLDMARNISQGSTIVAGDSIVVDITPVLPGSSIDAVSLFWALHTNPHFEDTIRGNLTGGTGTGGPYSETPGTGYNGWDVWTGQEGDVNTLGFWRYAFDLPDADFMYPGDILEWYVQATDIGGATGGAPLTSTYPANTLGFNDGNKQSYSRLHTVRALPTLTAAGQPEVLLLSLAGYRGGHAEVASALGQIGYEEGARESIGDEPAEYDVYTVHQRYGNGIGSAGAHGATAAQLAEYSTILLVGGSACCLLGNGGSSDTSNDIQALTDWQDLAGDRSIAYFADDIAFGVSSSSTTYLNTIMGVTFNDFDVADELGGAIAPLVQPTASGASAGFSADWVAFGGCPIINRFDSMSPFFPGPTNYKSHEWVANLGVTTGAAAGVVFDHTVGGHRKVNVTFPFGLAYVFNGGSSGSEGGISDRAALLVELLDFFGRPGGGGPITEGDAPPVPALTHLAARPNPFNPRTEISFRLGVAGPVTARLYDVAGRRVATLTERTVLDAGDRRLSWDGRDDAGSPVASGVYFVQIHANGYRRQIKIALLK